MSTAHHTKKTMVQSVDDFANTLPFSEQERRAKIARKAARRRRARRRVEVPLIVLVSVQCYVFNFPARFYGDAR